MKLLSGVKLSGPFMKVLISAVSSAGRRISAFSIRICELVPVVGQHAELEILRNAVHAPGLGDRLEAAHQQPADFFLDVDVAVGIAQHRQVRMHAIDAAR